MLFIFYSVSPLTQTLALHRGAKICLMIRAELAAPVENQVGDALAIVAYSRLERRGRRHRIQLVVSGTIALHIRAARPWRRVCRVAAITAGISDAEIGEQFGNLTASRQDFDPCNHRWAFRDPVLTDYGPASGNIRGQPVKFSSAAGRRRVSAVSGRNEARLGP